MAEFIDATSHSLWLQNERYQDQVIIERLVRAVRRGVEIHVSPPPPHLLKPDKLIEGVGGLRILGRGRQHASKHLKLHAKILLADGARRRRPRSTSRPEFRRPARTGDRDRRPGGGQAPGETVEHDWGLSHPST